MPTLFEILRVGSETPDLGLQRLRSRAQLGKTGRLCIAAACASRSSKEATLAVASSAARRTQQSGMFEPSGRAELRRAEPLCQQGKLRIPALRGREAPPGAGSSRPWRTGATRTSARVSELTARSSSAAWVSSCCAAAWWVSVAVEKGDEDARVKHDHAGESSRRCFR